VPTGPRRVIFIVIVIVIMIVIVIDIVIVMQAPTYPGLPHFRCTEEIQQNTDIDFSQFRADPYFVEQEYADRKQNRAGQPQPHPNP
jgi:hypothetical protein